MTDFSVGRRRKSGGIRASDNTSIFGVKARPALRSGDRDRYRRLWLFLDLEAVERRIATALAQQFVVAAGFDDGTALDDKDAIGVGDGVQPVGDGNGGAAFAEP